MSKLPTQLAATIAEALDKRFATDQSSAPLSNFFLIHMILHDIWGFDMIITRYLRYFKSANMVKIVFFLLKATQDN